jgi:hypothetical protein
MRALAILLFSLGLASYAAPRDASAQLEQRRHITASLGVFSYQLPHTGLAPMMAIRGTVPISSVLNIEAGIIGSRPKYPLGDNTTFIAPEAQLQLALPFESIIPYMGLGTGAVIHFGNGENGSSQVDMTISGSLGARVWLSDSVGIQAEFRGRGIGFDFASSSAEYSAGLAWQL